MTKKQKKLLVRIIISSALFLGLLLFGRVTAWSTVLWCGLYLLIGYDILLRAMRGLISLQLLDENFLMSVATLGAIALAFVGKGDFSEAVAVMLFYQIGEFFQSYAVQKSRKSIGELMDLRPDYANVEIDGKLVKISPEEIRVGDEIIVNSGEKIAVDGVIVLGESSLDVRALTGESLPKRVVVGDEVYGGCVNIGGVLRIRAIKEFSESTSSKILELAENASSAKSRSEAFITKFARIYTPAVCVFALLLAIVPPVSALAFKSAPMWNEWLYRALTFLVISCPCALVISVPLGFFSCLGGAGRQGILIKGSNYIETLSRLETVAFDKTGTITKGNFEVGEIKAIGCTPEQLMEYAVYAESGSSHPIAKSLIGSYSGNINRSRICEAYEVRGKGVSALVDGKRVVVGNVDFLTDEGIECEEINSSFMSLYVALDGKYAGYIVVCDSIKSESADGIAALKKIGVKRVLMLSGDLHKTAKEVGKRVGIDEVYASLLPADKVTILEEVLAQSNAKTAFVGDGINDTPVLARADVGIAMGAIGSDAALEAADVVIMDDDPRKIALAIRAAKKCMRIVRENIAITMGVKAVCLLLGALGLASMQLAIFADVGIMLLAVLNSLRVLIVKKI